MNSFKSACSLPKSTPVPFNQLEQDIEPFLWGQVSIELVVSSLCLFKATKYLNGSFHETDFTTAARPPARLVVVVSRFLAQVGPIYFTFALHAAFDTCASTHLRPR